ncbi:peptidylprolyl isomerase [Luteimonas sp. RD2P54]|uniref:Peptidyl-prolyl cis-trans isomerase n=1 Tax=Luteimonas endophytica TaxID=3042023 RepID=A0ABT6JBM8_9GAMM|nr:peptidylprolyl isomerase [Luteimonas endophytica]MDH5823985.1 peptidylprolyl isomerase [Luteimonas endophytica]
MDIANRRVGTLHFTLRDEDGRQITSTRGHDPLVYIHGTGSIVRGLEEALEGRSAGDRFEVTVVPEAGFGPRHPELVQTLPREAYTGTGEPAVGGRLEAQTARGPLQVVITAVEGDSITVDGNNPLAGRPFVAEVEVVDVRLATPEELQFGLG